MIHPTARAETLIAALVIALGVSLAPAARAAHETDVADALDPDHPIEVDLDVGYTHLRHDTKITRENLQSDAANPGSKAFVLVNELQHTEVDDQMSFRLAVGLYHDLELHIIAPYSFGDTQSWDYTGGTSAANSTLNNNHLNISGCNGINACSTSAAPQPILGVPGSSKRGGFGDPTIGVAWGPVNEEREEHLKTDLFPTGHPVSTWVLGFDYTLPLPGDTDDPTRFGAIVPGTASPIATTAGYSGTLFRHAHIFTPWTAFSIRYKVVNPYVSVRANLPYAINGSAWDNCTHTELLSDVATQNCALGVWKGETSYKPAFTGEFKVGSEFVVAEDPAAGRKFAIDLNGLMTWFSPSRDYSMVSDALGKLTYEDEHITTVGTLGIYGRAAKWLHFRVSGSLGFDTPHFLTDENIGKDLNGDGAILISAGGPNKSQEQSPIYDFRLDQVGRRLHAELTVIWGVSGFISLNF
jgi:hypothetical protein